MALTYSLYVTALATLLPTPQTDTNFINILPDCIDYAEQRCYRELNLLSTQIQDTNSTIGFGGTLVGLSQASGRFVTVSSIKAVNGTTAFPLMPLWPQLHDYLFFNAGVGTPQAYYMLNDQTFILGPAANQTYGFWVIGTIRPTPLSATNTTTYLSLYLPDLFLAASMIFMSGYMKNFGSQADDPKMAQSWETQYQSLLASAQNEETRKRYSLHLSTMPQMGAQTPRQPGTQ